MIPEGLRIWHVALGESRQGATGTWDDTWYWMLQGMWHGTQDGLRFLLDTWHEPNKFM